VPRGGAQRIPRPATWQPGPPNPWHGRITPEHLTPSSIEHAFAMHRLNPTHLPGPEPLRREPHSASRSAAVLAVLFPGADAKSNVASDMRVLLTRRASRMNSHSGEVAFPGGRVDDGETLIDAALREALEEVALPSSAVRIIGELEPITTVISDSAITPFVAISDSPLPPLAANEAEVARIFDVSLLELTSPDCYRSEIWDYPEGTFPVFFFEVDGDTIWGATGRMLHRLLTVITGN
jgi:8-oxo-dGTP pyrophosphatase MutT (NUDIX family)